MKTISAAQKQQVYQIITDRGWGGTRNATRRALRVLFGKKK